MEGRPGGVMIKEKLLRSIAQLLSVAGQHRGVRSWRRDDEVEMNVTCFEKIEAKLTKLLL